jgi:hypothetical protein
MSDSYKYYIVYRMDPNGRGTAYGWTFDKKILKTFIAQRSKKKYKAVRSSFEEITELFSEQVDGTGMYTIDWLELPSKKTGETVRLFLTNNERIATEKAIKKMLRDMSALDRIHGDRIEDYVEMMVNLREKYFSTLEFIGFQPKELEAMYDSIEENMTIGFNHETGAYYDMSPEEFYHSNNVSSGASNPIFDKVLWSLEAFVRVMKDDL